MAGKTLSLCIQREPPEHFLKHKRTICRKNFTLYTPPSKVNNLYSCIVLGSLSYHDQNQHGEEEICFTLTLLQHSPSSKEAMVRTQDQNLGSGTKSETTGECCLLACSPWLALPIFLYTLEDLPSRDCGRFGQMG